MIEAAHEGARQATGPGSTDAVTFAFGDAGAGLYGLARLGLSPGPEGMTGSALAVLFADREPVAAVARGGLAVQAGTGWESMGLAGLTTTIEAPLERWTVRLDASGADAGHGFELAFEALGAPAELAANDPVAAAGGMSGYEQLCRVRGTVRLGNRVREVECLGQRGHAWGRPDWEGIDATRSLAAWLSDGTGLALTAIRPTGAGDHAAEPVWAALLDREEVIAVQEPRLSTTFDGDGRQRRAGLELWVSGDEFPRRGAGEVLCGSTLDLGQLRLDCAFFTWRLQGREGVGRYDILRRA